jgi:hypothetical protein
MSAASLRRIHPLNTRSGVFSNVPANIVSACSTGLDNSNNALDSSGPIVSHIRRGAHPA